MLNSRLRPPSVMALTAMVLCVGLCRSALAQGQGQWRDGQYLGFVPLHLQQQHPDELRRAATTYQSLQDYTQSERSNGVTVEPLRRSTLSHAGRHHATEAPQNRVARTQFEEEIASAPYATDTVGELVFENQGYCGGCDACIGTCGSHNMWVGIELLGWDAKGVKTPALATSSPDGTDQDAAGVLPNATTLFGGHDIADDTRTGARVRFGVWLDPAQGKAIEFAYTFLEKESSSFSGSADDGTILARPFFNIDQDSEDARLIVFPNLVDGTLDVEVETKFQTAEVLYRRSVVHSHLTQISWTLGYRYANLKDTIDFQESTTALSGVGIDSTFDLRDSFETKNNFHGGQFGLKIVETPLPRWSVELGGKFAFGRTISKTTINGETTTTTASGATSTNAGGLLAQTSNIGTQEDRISSTMTEATVALRHRLPCGLIGSVGYSILYWSDVGRAGNAIDTSVNPTQIPPSTLSGSARPEYDFQSSDFWARGVNLGLEYNF